MNYKKHMLNEKLADGSTVESYTLSNSNGLEATIWTYGATIANLKVPDRYGISEEITLCYPTLSDLVNKPGPYFGAIIGRYANRIAKGSFILDGMEYHVPVNNGENSLHGGLIGYDKKCWTAEAWISDDAVGVNLMLISDDGEEGYPGQLTIMVTYAINQANQVTITYNATTTKPTIVNMTNHTYFNLSGNWKRNIYDMRLLLSCDKYLPSNEALIPTGELRSVIDTPFDFTASTNTSSSTSSSSTTSAYGKTIGSAVPYIDGGGQPGIDHCFVINHDDNDESTIMYHMATLTDEVSGRQMIVEGSQPSVQVYTGNFLSQDHDDHPYVQHNAICLETQHYPDAINQQHFPSVILQPDQQYHHQTMWSFKVVA